MLVAVALTGTVIVVTCLLALVLRGRSADVLYGLWVFLNGPAAVLSLWLGYLVLARFPRHGAGRILLAIGVLSCVHVLVATVADLQLVRSGYSEPLLADHGVVPASLPPQASVPLLLMNVLWVPVAVLALVLIAVFPDGTLRNRRWRWVPLAASAGAAALMAATAIDAWPTATWVAPEDAPPAVGVLFGVGGALLAAVLVGGIVSFVLRWRTSGTERRRFEVVGGALIVFATLGVATYAWPELWRPLVHVAFGAVLLTYGVAVARFRLHEVEPLVGKGIVISLVATLAAGVYLVLVIGVGRLVGARTDDQALPLVAVAVAALLTVPAHRFARRLVERRLYGDRADRADVLARVADHGGAVDDGAASDIAELVLRATDATRVEVCTSRGGAASVVAAGGTADGAPLVVAPIGPGPGEVRIYAHAAADLIAGSEELADDVAGLLWLMLENDRLTRDLADQLEQTRASRTRIVQAQERARRALEWDLHDGAQAQLIAIRMHLGELRRRASDAQPGDVTGDVERVATEVDAAIRQLRRLARGLHPPVLEQAGYVAGVRAHVRDASLPVTVVATGSARYSPVVESAAYFTCLEAIQNALRHADADEIAVAATCEPGALSFTVTDDGRGFDVAAAGTGLEGMSDRVGALGGQVEVRSAPGAGTRVSVTIPATPSTPDVQRSSAAR